ncbi:MAG: phosphate ABC transporter permease subunit PstC [Verrucomicrobiales bacterium]|jgi:phosphate transport system permease protein|nr:phosphate ABC transporter permease subunit PstC [Verrucomicrobiales bacterium]
MASQKKFIRVLGAKLDSVEPLIRGVIFLSGWSSIIFVAAIFFFIIKEAAPIMPHVDWGKFFFENRWIPNPAEGNEAQYGAAGILYGTFAITVVSMFIAMPLGLGAAIYISEFAGPKVKETLKILIEFLAAVPSIIWGFIGLMVMGPLLQKVLGIEVGINLLNASIVVALMAVPLIVSISEDALRAVPDSYREAALALGASRWEIVYRVLFPAAKNGLLAACMLGVGRAVGETMAVWMASGSTENIPENFFNPALLLERVKALTATIASEMPDTAHGDDHYRMLFVIGIVLLLISVVINVISDIVIKGIRNKHK